METVWSFQPDNYMSHFATSSLESPERLKEHGSEHQITVISCHFNSFATENDPYAVDLPIGSGVVHRFSIAMLTASTQQQPNTLVSGTTEWSKAAWL